MKIKIKNIFLVASFLVISNLSFAQVWSLAELIKVANMNIDDADTYITNKGYAFSSVRAHDSCEERSYSYNKFPIT